MQPSPDPELRGALAGLRGLLLDLDGVLVLKERAIDGAGDAVARLNEAGFPYLVVTNTTLVSRRTLAAETVRVGIPLEPERIATAASASAAYVRRTFADLPLYVLGAPDALSEFDGLRLLSHDEAAERDARVAAVVVGDAGDDFTPRNMRSAFRLVRAGARLIAMHKNRWWLTPDGEVLDAGGFVAGLEYALERRALVLGKPSAALFREAVRELGEQPGGAGRSGGSGESGRATGHAFAPSDVAMVGDDVWNDVLGAQRAGLRGVFVHSGKHGGAELAKAAASGRRPTAVAPSVAEVVAAVLDR